MAVRRSHYELAFEALLGAHRIAFVAVEDVRHIARGKVGAKLFDYIVYPQDAPPVLVDVKGRKAKVTDGGADCRQKTWVTRGDVEGMRIWQGVFGDEYDARFVFAYWLAGHVATGCGDNADWELAGRCYRFWSVPVADYATHQKPLSKSWDTVSVPLEAFRAICEPLSAWWKRPRAIRS